MPGLQELIKNKTARIGVIGLGYVGLPLLLTFAEAGFKVLGFDIQQKRVNLVKQGKSYISDVSDEQISTALAKGLLDATTDQNRLAEADVICVCVPTPLTKTKEPDLSYVVQECEEISKNLRSGQLIILENTTYPGTTREVALPILERSGLKVGADFYLAFSPERIDPGSKKYGIKNTPKLVGGVEPESTELANLFYQQVVDKTVRVSSSETAEMTKLFENVFRNVNIALVNEMAQLCERMGLSVWEVIDAAATKPFGYMRFYPGPGVGGHCIPLNPHYLSDRAIEYDFHTSFVNLAVEINEQMPYYVASRVMEALNTRGKSMKGAKVLVLGVAYKNDSEDMRESPSLKLIQLFREKGANVSYNDPFIPQIQVSGDKLNSVELTRETLSSMDCTVIATSHSSYNMKQIVAWSKLVFDTRGVTRHLGNSNIVRLGE